MKNRRPEAKTTAGYIMRHWKPGISRVIVLVHPSIPISTLLEIPETILNNEKPELRKCTVLQIGSKIKLPLSIGDITFFNFRPTFKLWDSMITSDGHIIAFLPEEAFIGVNINE